MRRAPTPGEIASRVLSTSFECIPTSTEGWSGHSVSFRFTSPLVEVSYQVTEGKHGMKKEIVEVYDGESGGLLMNMTFRERELVRLELGKRAYSKKVIMQDTGDLGREMYYAKKYAGQILDVLTQRFEYSPI